MTAIFKKVRDLFLVVIGIFKKDNYLDKNKLLSLINSAAEGNFALYSDNDFVDKEFADAYNTLINRFLQSCNQTVMELNNSMEIIGNCNNMRAMLQVVEQQKDSLCVAEDTGKGISESINKCEEILNTINSDISSVYDNSMISKDAIRDMISNVNHSYLAINETADAIKGFSEKSEEIKNILNVVNDIASQVQILSFNAKIEASRSSEGTGFSVVADEIGKLSLDTRKSVDKMTGSLYEILADIQQVVKRFDNLCLLMEADKSSAIKTERSVQKMADNTQNVINEISNLYNHMNNQNAATKSFAENIITIAKCSDELELYCREPGKDMHTISRAIDKIRTRYVKSQSRLSDKELIDVYNIDHLIFTGRLYNMIEEFEKLKLKNLNNPKGCKFGKWMQKLKKENPPMAEKFDFANMYHEQLHELASLCFYANEAGEKEKALEIFEKAQEVYKKFSAELNRLKTLWEI